MLAFELGGAEIAQGGIALALRARPDTVTPARTLAVSRVVTLAACPGRALEEWLRGSETRFGPVFRKVDRWGHLEYARLGTDAVRRILASQTLRRAHASPPSGESP